MRVPLIATILVTMLGACTTPISPPPPGPPEVRAAYSDGCAAGYGYAGSPFHSNRGTEPAGAVSAAYRAGWLEGFDKCRRSYDRIQLVIHGLFGAP